MRLIIAPLFALFFPTLILSFLVFFFKFNRLLHLFIEMGWLKIQDTFRFTRFHPPLPTPHPFICVKVGWQTCALNETAEGCMRSVCIVCKRHSLAQFCRASASFAPKLHLSMWTGGVPLCASVQNRLEWFFFYLNQSFWPKFDTFRYYERGRGSFKNKIRKKKGAASHPGACVNLARTILKANSSFSFPWYDTTNTWCSCRYHQGFFFVFKQLLSSWLHLRGFMTQNCSASTMEYEIFIHDWARGRRRVKCCQGSLLLFTL